MPPLTSVFGGPFGNSDHSHTDDNPPPPPQTESLRAGAKAHADLEKKSNNEYVPLPVQLSTKGIPGAEIKGRVIDLHGVWYTVTIGPKTLTDVALDEILDYVSSYDLEEFEHAQFREENEARDAADRAARVEALQRREARRARASTKGYVTYESVDDSESATASSMSDAATGKHGRKRPTYTHMFALNSTATTTRAARPSGVVFDKDLFTKDGKPRQRRRRRKRDAETGELLPLSDDDDEDEIVTVPMALDSSDMDIQSVPSADNDPNSRRRTQASFLMDQQATEPEKKRRRKRHPITKELMPLGWRYNPDAPEERARVGKSNTPSMPRLSFLPDQSPKRVKLSDDSSPEPRRGRSTAPRQQVKPRQVTVREHITLSSSSSSSDAPENRSESALQQFLGPAKAPRPSGQLGSGNNVLTIAGSSKESFASSSNQSSASAFKQSTVKQQSGLRKTMTSIQAPLVVEDSDDEAEKGGERFVNIIKIVEHATSDPTTHGEGMGTKSVLLYRVEWEGGDLTWEPKQSFPDPSTLEQYHRKIGQTPEEILAVRSGTRARPSTVMPRETSELDSGSSEMEE